MRENGLRATAYVAVADLHPQLADIMLEALADEGVAAYASPPSSGRGLAMPAQFPAGPVDRLWVDRDATATARRVLDERLPELRAELEKAHADAANARTGPGGDPDAAPGGILVDDHTWAAIIASYRAESAGTSGWPDAENVDPSAEQDTNGPRDAARSGAGSAEWPEQRVPSRRPVEDPTDHFEPPAPPPLPVADSTTRLAWAGVVGGPVLLLLSVVLGWELASWAQVAGVTAMVVGFVTLVARMRDGSEDDGGDSGAVV